jgi:predicted phosphodiesterase
MTRIAAISDIHGNLGALEAVLYDIRRRGVDMTVNLGDILSGPLLPRETAECLMELKLPTISGNHERQILTMSLEDMGASDRYAAATITESQREWLSALPKSLWLSAEIFLCHGTPESDIACYLEDIEEGELIPASLTSIEERTGACGADLIFCGHSHIPRVARLRNGQTIVNPGSVGSQAYHGHHPAPHRLEVGSPHARYAIATKSGGGWMVEQICVPYDWESAAQLAEMRGREDWVNALLTGFL